MGIHPKDQMSDNPRMQCVVCAKWKRLYCDEPYGPYNYTQMFFGGCSFCDGGEHLASKNGDTYVCQPCCERECKRISELAAPATGKEE